MGLRLGPVTKDQLKRFGNSWEQGQHVFVSGPTGSGKTTLARQIVEQRIARGGHVIVMVAKPVVDPTILKEYRGWTRWTRMRKRGVAPSDKRILLWPKVEGKPASEALPIQREVFAEAFDILSMVGHWTVQVDEGLYNCNPMFLNLAQPLAMGLNIGRSSNLTYVTLTQRPSHLPLVCYSSASHAFVGQHREMSDLKRIAAMDGINSKEITRMVSGQGRRDFLWLPIAPGWESESVHLTR